MQAVLRPPKQQWRKAAKHTDASCVHSLTDYPDATPLLSSFLRLLLLTESLPTRKQPRAAKILARG
jgi:hypothetical protein